MNKAQLNAIKKHFHDYATLYMDRAGTIVHMMELKRIHCAFVAKNCRELAQGEGWNKEDVNTAESLGFLHDIGRFPQLEEYGTFKDADSIDHGERGYQAILESDLLAEMEPDRQAAVLNAVRHHNDKELMTDIPADHLKYLKLIRDADRLDIYRVVYEAVAGDKFKEHPEICLGLPFREEPSNNILERISKRERVAYDELNCSADFLMLILSWCYQMNYSATLMIMQERNILADFAAHLPMHITAVSQVIAQMEDFTAEGRILNDSGGCYGMDR